MIDLSQKEKLRAYKHAKVGLEFEFIPDRSPKQVARDLSIILKEDVSFVKNIEKTINKDPLNAKYILHKDWSGGIEMIELVTPPLEYFKVDETVNKILSYIRTNCNTDNNCSVHINVSIDPPTDRYGIREFNLERLNKLKLLLEIDENFIYKMFPKRKNSIYAKSVKEILPVSPFTFNFENTISEVNFKYPNRKYYGVNFLHLPKYIEFRYLGGEGYEFMEDEIDSSIDYFIETLYAVLKYPKLTEENVFALKENFSKQADVIEGCRNLFNFKNTFPKINLTVDLSKNEKRLNLHWDIIKEKILPVLLDTKIKKGNINYDTDLSRLQLQYCEMKGVNILENIDLDGCEASGHFTGCDIRDSSLNDSEFHLCEIRESVINNSKIINTLVSDNSKIFGSYFSGGLGILDSIFNTGIFASGYISSDAEVKDEVKIIKFKKLKKYDNNRIYTIKTQTGYNNLYTSTPGSSNIS